MRQRTYRLWALAGTLVLAAAYFLWQRGWVLRAARALLTLTADSLTMAGILVWAVGMVLRHQKRGKTVHKDLPPDLTEADLERARQTRRAIGTAMAQMGGLALAGAVVLSVAHLVLF